MGLTQHTAAQMRRIAPRLAGAAAPWLLPQQQHLQPGLLTPGAAPALLLALHGRALATQAPAAAAAADQALEVPGGGRVPYTISPDFRGGVCGDEGAVPKVPVYRTLDGAGRPIDGAHVPHDLDQPLAVRLYTAMARLQVMDTLFYEAQRQGRFSFYMTSAGEEATVVGSAAGLAADDMVFAQYREQGVLLWRGFSFLDFANQCYGNKLEQGKGRQMPIHYGSRQLHYQTISSPLATQLPHAAGAAYAMKLARSGTVAATYFGEGASSEGDFHAALNFAAVLGAPALFICRNNGYAISTPATEQYKGDGVAGRGPSYHMPTIRVDGGDARAVHCATAEARALALRHATPVLIECMSYRSGHHSTSDDSSRYRTREEMASWKARDPVVRFRNWLTLSGWWDEGKESALRRELRQQVVSALDQASRVEKPDLSCLFTDVYADMPWNLTEQLAATLEFARKHPEVVPPDVPVR